MPQISFGTVAPIGWRRELSKDKPPNEQYQTLVDHVVKVEKLGYDSTWLFDHLHTYPEVTSDSFFECWTVTAALASETSKIRLGQMVTCNHLRFPSVLAKMASTIDNISNGRLELGLGACWGQEELEAYGYEFPSANIRLDMLEEAVQLVKLMLTQSPTSFQGRYYSIKEAVNEPKSIQRPHPPITIGGAGPNRTIPIVAKYADRCNFGALRYYHEYVEGFRQLDYYARKYGREPSRIERTCLRELVLAESEFELAKKQNQLKVEDGVLTPRSKPYIENRIIGTADQCAYQLRAFKELGVTLFILYFRDALENDVEEIFITKVAPKLT